MGKLQWSEMGRNKVAELSGGPRPSPSPQKKFWPTKNCSKWIKKYLVKKKEEIEKE